VGQVLSEAMQAGAANDEPIVKAAGA
jgi:hypothetical protein